MITKVIKWSRKDVSVRVELHVPIYVGVNKIPNSKSKRKGQDCQFTCNVNRIVNDISQLDQTKTSKYATTTSAATDNVLLLCQILQMIEDNKERNRTGSSSTNNEGLIFKTVCIAADKTKNCMKNLFASIIWNWYIKRSDSELDLN